MKSYKSLLKHGPFYKFKAPSQLYIRRWPKNPKLSIITPPGLSKHQIANRVAIDLAIPVVSINKIYTQIIQNHYNQYSHPFYQRVRKLLLQNNYTEIMEQRIPIKLLMLHPYTQQGFLLTDFPNNVQQAEQLQQLYGGMNGMIHCWLEKQWLSQRYDSRYIDPETKQEFYMNSVIEDQGDQYYHFENPDKDEEFVRLDKKLPVDQTVAERVKRANNRAEFERKFQNYLLRLGKIEPFYKHYGLLTNYRMARGMDDFGMLKHALKNTIKH